MPDSIAPGQTNALYYQCFEKLLPIAGQHLEAVSLDWWDLDRFLGLAFYTLLAETDIKIRKQIATLFPAFGAKAVPPLIVLYRQPNLDPESSALVNQTLAKFNSSELISGLINVLKSSEDDSFDASVSQRLAGIGHKAISAVESLLSDPEWAILGQRILPQVQKFQAIKRVQQSPRFSSNKMPRDYLKTCKSEAQDHRQASLQNTANLNPSCSAASTLAPQSTALMNMAAYKAETSSYSQAIDIYTEALAHSPDSAWAYGARGLLRSNIGDQQGAIADMRYAAHLFHQQGKNANFEIALGYLRKIMRHVPS